MREYGVILCKDLNRIEKKGICKMRKNYKNFKKSKMNLLLNVLTWLEVWLV
jgi:hypothetical protein